MNDNNNHKIIITIKSKIVLFLLPGSRAPLAPSILGLEQSDTIIDIYIVYYIYIYGHNEQEKALFLGPCHLDHQCKWP
jgi:hypothetical protein